MNKFVKVLAVLSLAVVSAQAGTTRSHTFFSVRPNFQSAMPERVALWRDDLINDCRCGIGGAFEAVFYCGRTTCEGSQKLADYFLPQNCKNNCLNFREFNEALDFNPLTTADRDPYKDIEATNFNIVTQNAANPFSSNVCFRPVQQKFGIGLVYKSALSYKCDGAVGFWFEGSLPIERVRNRVYLRESIENSGGGADLNSIGLDDSFHVDSVRQAFAQPNWKYGKIDNRCCKEKWGVADIELKFGYNTINIDCANLNSYIGVLIPTGNRVKGREVFEPIVGNNHHAGVLLGNSIGFILLKNCKTTLALFIDGATRYLFSNHQIRSFDLVNKQWSRYQAVYSSPEQAAFAASLPLNNPNSETLGTSGINVFTTCFKVKPHFSSDLTTAFVLASRCGCLSYQFELGYNLYIKQAEQIEPKCCNLLRNVAIKDVLGDGVTNNARNIRQNFAGAFSNFNNGRGYLNLSPCDIDLESASHPAVVSNIFYGALGVKGENSCPYFTSVGGSYEWTHRKINANLDRWLVWGKFGFAF